MRTVANRHVFQFAGLDVPALLAQRARDRRDHPFIKWEPFEGQFRSWTYGAFAADVERIAAGLQARGLKAGDRLLIHLDNCPELLLAWYACARLGAVAVTTNARSSADELAYFADHCNAAAAVTQPRFAELVAAAAPGATWLAITETDNGVTPPYGQQPGEDESFAALAGEPADLPKRAPDPLAPVGVQYTSGTTSRPKGVLWTHANALWGFKINAVHQDLRPEDVHLCFMPLFHTNAQAYSVGAALWAGATCVIQPRFSASRFWPVSLKHGCTWASTLPFAMKALMSHEVPERHAYRLWGTAYCSPPTDAHFRVKTIGWWGMTETMTHGIVGDVHLPNTPLAIGRPAPEYEIAVRRPDGTDCGPGETGDLLVRGIRGLSLFQEYLHNPEATAAAYTGDGWFITGDKIRLLECGSLQFSDRAKDMLKVGAENVAASEVERVIMEVAGVDEVAVVAKRHAMLDEVPVAFILPLQGKGGPALAREALARCRRQLADFKVPREVYLVDALPRSTLEKIAKAELRRRLAEAEAGAPAASLETA